MIQLNFSPRSLEATHKESLDSLWRSCVGDIIKSVTLARSGHPGGSLSSLHALLLIYANIKHHPENPQWAERDRVVISHGHIAAGTYAVLSRFGYFSTMDYHLGFRRAGSPFSGHVETCVPGIYWNTGNLGQGLSAGTAAALAGKLRGADYRTFVLMGDGEQQKGQIAEARRFAVKNKLNRLIAIIDYNRLQIGGDIGTVMPHNLKEDWVAAGWNVLEVQDGNNFETLYGALRQAYRGETEAPDRPAVILASTTMGKGVSFMENLAAFHGSAPKPEQAREALKALGQEDNLNVLWAMRDEALAALKGAKPTAKDAISDLTWPKIDTGTPITYETGDRLDNRSAYGHALADLAEKNMGPNGPTVLGLTCDLEGSVKMNILRKRCPGAFFECGIQEHHTAALTGALSREGLVPFFSTFGVFGIDEAYNQNRLSDQNHAAPKIVLTHCGLDVGEDGPTHQCIDYLSLGANLFGFEVFHPADPNQTDRMIRTLAARPKPSLVCMGRSLVPIVTRDDQTPYFGGDYQFQVGKADLIRAGQDLTIFTYGPILQYALDAAAQLEANEKITVRILNMATLWPLDRQAIRDAAKETRALMTVEDHNVRTGLGLFIAGALVEDGLSVPLMRLGVSRYGSSGSPAALYGEQGLDTAGIIQGALKLLSKRPDRTCAVEVSSEA